MLNFKRDQVIRVHFDDVGYFKMMIRDAMDNI